MTYVCRNSDGTARNSDIIRRNFRILRNNNDVAVTVKNELSRGNFGCRLDEHSPNGPTIFVDYDDMQLLDPEEKGYVMQSAIRYSIRRNFA